MSAAAEWAPSLTITEPGVYDIPQDAYFADPVPTTSLSSSGARKLLPPSCPAIFRHEQLHGQPHKRTFDIGHAAHLLVLGAGAPLLVVEAEDWRTKAAREARDEAYALGHTPILAGEYEQVQAMAAALREHPIASALFDPDHGKPEQSLFWNDSIHDVWRRARLDWLPETTTGRMIAADYKTCVSAEPSAIEKAMGNYGYFMQAPWYIDAILALGLAEDVAFVFVFQEKTAPYLVTVAQLEAHDLQIGRHRNNRALEVYAECVRTDTWPGYTSDVAHVSLPPWVLNHLETA